jgi:hypothetical protein
MKTFCINLKRRKDRKKKMVKQFLKYKMEKSVEFFTAKLHPDGGVAGCRDSHLQIIQKAKSLKLPYVMILEDDLQFSQNLHKLPEFPKEWSMLYLGGTLTSNIGESEEKWVKIKDCWTTCGYILHSSLYDKVIKDLQSYQDEVDRYYVEEIQHEYHCYLVNPIMVKQRNDYSDIEKRNVNYDVDTVLRNPYREALHEIKDKEYILKTNEMTDDELPNVTIITPTRNRKELFCLALNNFYNTEYPPNKLEWVIVDDGDEDQKVKTILPEDNRIKYLELEVETPLPISQKRNIAVQQASNEIILHMDDDDFYYPQHVLSRVKTLLSNEGVKCVGCTQLGCYNVLNQKSFKIGDKHSVLAEATMCYYKSFWKERAFFERVKTGEAIHFLKSREKEVAQFPFTYVMIALTHKTNVTKKLRTDEETSEKSNVVDGVHNLWNEFDLFTRGLLKRLY